MSVLSLEQRERVGKAATLLLPSFGTCQRCHMPWPLTHDHTTYFRSLDQPGAFGGANIGGAGMFALCLACWSDLTPEQRLPFYRLIYERWLNYGTDVAWQEIEAAVLAGK